MADETGRNHMVLDATGKILWKKSLPHADDKRHHGKSFLYYAVGNHVYPVTDSAMRKALANEPDTQDVCVDGEYVQ